MESMLERVLIKRRYVGTKVGIRKHRRSCQGVSREVSSQVQTPGTPTIGDTNSLIPSTSLPPPYPHQETSKNPWHYPLTKPYQLKPFYLSRQCEVRRVNEQWSRAPLLLCSVPPCHASPCYNPPAFNTPTTPSDQQSNISANVARKTRMPGARNYRTPRHYPDQNYPVHVALLALLMLAWIQFITQQLQEADRQTQEAYGQLRSRQDHFYINSPMEMAKFNKGDGPSREDHVTFYWQRSEMKLALEEREGLQREARQIRLEERVERLLQEQEHKEDMQKAQEKQRKRIPTIWVTFPYTRSTPNYNYTTLPRTYPQWHHWSQHPQTQPQLHSIKCYAGNGQTVGPCTSLENLPMENRY